MTKKRITKKRITKKDDVDLLAVPEWKVLPIRERQGDFTAQEILYELGCVLNVVGLESTGRIGLEIACDGIRQIQARAISPALHQALLDYVLSLKDPTFLHAVFDQILQRYPER